MDPYEEEGDVLNVSQDPFYVEAEDDALLASTVEPPSERRRISRVVVEHNDSFETFYNFDDVANPLQNCGASVGNDVFFDNDSFWSGSITWY